MPVYVYRALNEEGREVQGTIDSPDIETAQNALVHDMHLDPIEVQEPMRIRREQKHAEPPASARTPLLTFTFEGTDPQGFPRRGTIQADSRLNAFQKLHRDQKLYLSLLSQAGTKEEYNDAELAGWQKNESLVIERPHFGLQPIMPNAIPEALRLQKAAPVPTPPALTPPPVRTLVAHDRTPDEGAPHAAAAITAPRRYAPLLSTIQLYCGWLFAWYGLFVGLGYYAHVRALPVDLSLAEGFALSPLIFTLVLAIFLFLMLRSVHRAVRGGWRVGALLALLGMSALVYVRASIGA